MSILLACGGEKQNPNFGNQSGAQASADTGPNGERIYKTRCVACHGAKGDMGANGAANLQQSQISLAERITTVTHGRLDKGMTAFKGILSPEEIEAVSQYTLTLQK
jgi:Cytochrome c, mono- and diheme variants